MSLKEYYLTIQKNTSTKSVVIISLVSLLYLVFCRTFIGYKSDQLVLIILINLLFYLSIPTRKFLFGFSIFIVFWVIFDSMKVLPNYTVNDIHLEDLYQAEKSLFGITEDGIVYTPNEYARRYISTGLDILAGLFYLNWVPVPLIFAGWLFAKNKSWFLSFSLSFLFVNIIGFILYYLYPAAPPWYVQLYGFELHYHTPGNTAGLAGFDNYFGVTIFHALYSKSSNVFAAMPSLHSAYPVVVLYYGLKNKLGWINIFFVLLTLGIWSAAVYTSHHYVLDVIAGVCCAITGLLIFDYVLMRMNWFRKIIDRYREAIS